MSERRFTAQEMRRMAGFVRCPNADQENAVSAMLRYAAGVVERCNGVNHDLVRDISAMNGYPLNMDAKDFVEKLNYILRGDAEEGGGDGK